jgi:hypothetical protein
MGAINVKHTGSGADVSLSSDGTDLLLDGSAIGGGGGGSALELYAENPSSPTAPSATGTNAVAIGNEAVASGTKATAIGDANSSGSNSFATSISNRSATYGARGTNSFAAGYLSRATGLFAGGNSANASGSGSICIGNSATSSGTNSLAFATQSEAKQQYSLVLGRHAVSDVIGKMAFAISRFSRFGDAQTGTSVLRSDTTDATPEALTTNNASADATNQVILPNNSAFAFHGKIVARQQASGGTACAAWKVEGLIRREANAGTTVLVNSATTILDNTPDWGMALSADTTNGGLKIEVTGEASTNIRWVATINTSEVTY